MRRRYQTGITSREPRIKVGSALILAVVLTSLLAIVGVLFVLASRVEKIATEATAENRELNLAIDTVLAKISQELVRDTPGVAGQEYYDYPDANNLWLAVLEPSVDDKGTPALADDQYYWRQISALYKKFPTPDLPAQVVPDYQLPRDMNEGFHVDADGDGVADSRWVIIPDVTGSKGEPIFAAIRVVDNGALLNVNTGYKFDPNVIDPNSNFNLLDGNSPLQVNLMALSWRPAPGVTTFDPVLDDQALLEQRYKGSGIDPLNLPALLSYLRNYERNVVWRYRDPDGPYTPFDIADELELRYRFLLNHADRIDTRLEQWGGEFSNIWVSWTPFTSLGEWFRSTYDNPGDGIIDPNYAYRRLATIYNMDRIIDPNGDKMININDPNIPVGLLYDRLLRSMRAGLVPDPNIRWRLERECAQLAANIVDFADNDTEVTVITDPCGFTYYGFDAQPFITEIAWSTPSPETPRLSHYAVELYNPFDRPLSLWDFQLELVSALDPCAPPVIIPLTVLGEPDQIRANGHLIVVTWPDSPAALGINPLIVADPNVRIIYRPALQFFAGWSDPDRSRPVVDRRPGPYKGEPPIHSGWRSIYNLYLRRLDVPTPPSATGIYVDQQLLDPTWPLLTPGYYSRDDRNWHVIYQTLMPVLPTLGALNGIVADPNLGHNFSFFLPNPLRPRARFVTVGDLPRVLTIGNGVTRNSTIGEQLWGTPRTMEANIRLDLQNPYHRDVFQYLTVFDPSTDNIDNDGDTRIDPNDRSEWKIPGRININTAPWYVIAQLPWMTDSLAQTALAYRDKLSVPGIVDYSGPLGRQNATTILGLREAPGFASTGELNFVIGGAAANYNIGVYALDGNDLLYFPDLTTDGIGLGDGIANDFEERDVIFSRISNLVTVRSDVFTAYILVRVGADGPQKRVIAILDRSGVYTGKDQVRLVALHDVSDPR